MFTEASASVVNITPVSRIIENNTSGVSKVAEIPTVAVIKTLLGRDIVANPNSASVMVAGVPGMERDNDPLLVPAML